MIRSPSPAYSAPASPCAAYSEVTWSPPRCILLPPLFQVLPPSILNRYTPLATRCGITYPLLRGYCTPRACSACYMKVIQPLLQVTTYVEVAKVTWCPRGVEHTSPQSCSVLTPGLLCALRPHSHYSRAKLLSEVTHPLLQAHPATTSCSRVTQPPALALLLCYSRIIHALHWGDVLLWGSSHVMLS